MGEMGLSKFLRSRKPTIKRSLDKIDTSGRRRIKC
jgi:hypothetical protein